MATAENSTTVKVALASQGRAKLVTVSLAALATLLGSLAVAIPVAALPLGIASALCVAGGVAVSAFSGAEIKPEQVSALAAQVVALINSTKKDTLK